MYFNCSNAFRLIYSFSFCICFVMYHAITVDPLKFEYLKQSTIQDVSCRLVTFPCSSCFLTITNFRGVNINYLANQAPILLRRYFPLSTYNWYRVYATAELADIVERNGQGRINFHLKQGNCSSIFLIQEYQNICVMIKFLIFLVGSRPWNYIQNVYLFPPLVNTTFLGLWKHYSLQTDYRYIPSLHIGLLILDTDLPILSWIKYYFESNFGHLNCFQNTPDQELLIGLKFIKITRSTSNMEVIPFCGEGNSVNLHKKYLTDFEFTQTKNHINTKLSSTTNISSWELSLPYLLTRKILDCTNDINFAQKLNNYEIDHLLFCFSTFQTWRAILKSNFIVGKSKFLETEINFFMGFDVDSASFSVDFLSEQLRFISCGDTLTTKSYLHTTLFESYDIHCWIAIFVVFVVIIPASWGFMLSNSCFNLKVCLESAVEILKQVFKNLLEQSTPDSVNVLNGPHLKILATVSLIGTLIFSNAYKNDNMLRIVSPQKFRPLENFNQLLENKYTVLSEPHFVVTGINCNSNFSLYTNCIESAYNVDQHVFKLISDKISLYVSSLLGTYFTDICTIGGDHILPKQFQYIYDNSGIWMQPVYQIGMKHVSKSFIGFLDSFKETVFEEGQLLATELLQMCNKTAFIATYTRVLEIENVLKKQGLKRVSISQEILMEKRLGFYFVSRWVPDFIVTRIGGIQSSGIIKWWNAFVVRHLLIVRAKSKHFWINRESKLFRNDTKPLIIQRHDPVFKKLYGITLVFATGCLIAFVCWLLEIFWKFVLKVLMLNCFYMSIFFVALLRFLNR